MGQNLNVARGHVGVFLTGGAGLDLPGNLQHKFWTHLVGDVERLLRCAAVHGDLGFAPTVAQINEDNAAHVATAVDPSGECDCLSDVIDAKFATSMRFEHLLYPLTSFFPDGSRNQICPRLLPALRDISQRERHCIIKRGKVEPPFTVFALGVQVRAYVGMR